MHRGRLRLHNGLGKNMGHLLISEETLVRGTARQRRQRLGQRFLRLGQRREACEDFRAWNAMTHPAERRQRTTESEFLAARGLESPFADYTLDKCRLPHGETARQRAKRLRDTERALGEYSARRQAAIAEYNALVAAGIIAPKTRAEILIDRANGHPDNESTQAARRICAKRGIEWRI